MRKKTVLQIIAFFAVSILLTGCEDMKQVVSGLEQTRDYLQEADQKLKEARGQVEDVCEEINVPEINKDEIQAVVENAEDEILNVVKSAKETERAANSPSVKEEKTEEKSDAKDKPEAKSEDNNKEEIEESAEDSKLKQTDEGADEKTDSKLIFSDGAAQPIIEYSDGFEKGYSNENSEILRYTVYVETDNDTDGDGLADLVKVLVQLPRAAAEGKYKVASVYDPSPDNAGTVEAETVKDIAKGDEEFDFDCIYEECEKRTPTGTVKTIEHAEGIDASEWIYSVPVSGEQGYKYGKKYDYYLTRGFAVVEASGLGTYGSEGFELPGLGLERDAHKCVVEWLTGERVAYADRFGTETIEADWSNGNVAMTGISYGGALSYETATTGVAGLKTVIPVEGIASSYDYLNSQGVSKNSDENSLSALASFAGGSLFLDDDWTVVNDNYSAVLETVSSRRNAAGGNYTDIWSESDYSVDYKDIQCSALIVQGLNDFDITAKQADLMYKAFEKSRNEVKLVFHQDGCNSLDGKMINDELWDEVMNKWLCHYLYDIDNGIEEMAELTVQSNVDGSFVTYDSWREFDYETYDVSYEKKKSKITSKGLEKAAADYYADSLKQEDRDMFYLSLSEDKAGVYTIDIPENTTICGVPKISFLASTGKTNASGLMATAVLVDTIDGETGFKAFMPAERLGNTLPVRTVGKYLKTTKERSPVKEFVMSNTKAKVISYGRLDIANPGGGYYGKDYEEDSVIEKNKLYDYTFFMQPTVYTVEKGHTLKLVLTTYDPQWGIEGRDGFDYTVDNTSLKVEIPVKE